MQQEKQGFIYIWYDRKRNMFYLGSHWGTEDDGYICSSNRMRKAYRRRPQDFKRRILNRFSFITREHLLQEEERWLKKAEKKKTKYYNIMFRINFNFALCRKGVVFSFEHRKNLSKAMTGKKMSEEHRRNLSLSHKGQKAPNKGIPHSDATKRKIGDANRGSIHTPEALKKIQEASKRMWEKRKALNEI